MKRTKNTVERISFATSSLTERNQLALQYEPLVNKIVKQLHSKVQYPWNEIKSMAYEGLVLAFNTFDPERSNMTFTQFAAFAIRNNILTRLSEETRTVKMSSYMQQKEAEAGGTLFTSVSLTTICGESNTEDSYSREGKYGLYDEATYTGDPQPLEELVNTIKANFDDRDCDAFFSYYGLGGHEELKVKELADKYNVTNGLISQRIKKVIKFIRTQPELLESLATLLN